MLPQNACEPDCVVDFLVENMGRASFGRPHQMNNQRKGLHEGPIFLDGEKLEDWTIVPLEFKQDWMNR